MTEQAGANNMREGANPAATNPDITLKFQKPRSTDTQPYIPLSQRVLEPVSEGEIDKLFEQLKVNDPEFVREVEVAFKGTYSTLDVRILDWRHVAGNKYAFTALVDGQPREMIVERQAKPKLP